MRLSPGTIDYQACANSLSDTARGIGQARATAEAREACLQAGYRPGDQAMALCVLDRVRRTSAPPPIRLAAGQARGLAPKSYPSMSFDEQRGGEEASCATLGLEPGSAGFAHCVASLDLALWAAQRP